MTSPSAAWWGANQRDLAAVSSLQHAYGCALMSARHAKLDVLPITTKQPFAD